MTAVTPLVLVYQELAGVSGAAEEPTMESLIMGPCYHIRDYPAHRDEIEVETFGDREAPHDPSGSADIGLPSGIPFITLDSAPDDEIGAQLDHESVEVYLEEVMVEMSHGADGEFGATAPDENLFTAAGEEFAADGVRPGDRLAVNTTGGETYFFTVKEVGGYDGSGLEDDELKTSANFLDMDNTSLLWRVEKELDEAVLPEDFVVLEDDAIAILSGAELVVSVDGDDYVAEVTYAKPFVEYRSLRKDLAKVTRIDDNNLEDVLGEIDERNPLAVGAKTALDNTTTSLQVYGVDGDDLQGSLDSATAYSQGLTRLERREDTYLVTPLTKNMDVIDNIHDHAVKVSDPEKAKFRTVVAQGTELPDVKTVGTASVSGTTEQVDIDDVSVLAFDSSAIADFGGYTPEERGMREGVDFYIVNSNETNEGVYELDGAGEATVLSQDFENITEGPDEIEWYTLRGSGFKIDSVSDVEVTGPGEIVVGEGASMSHSFNLIRLVGSADNATTSPVENEDFLITAVDEATGTYTVVGPDLVLEQGLEAKIVMPTDSSALMSSGPQTVEFRKSFRRLKDNTASFTTNGVLPGDHIQVPLPPQVEGAEFDDDVYEAVVESILSENRLVLERGSDIPTVDSTAAQEDDLGYRVVRSLDRQGQKEELLSVVDPQTGYNSKRLILVWPDEVMLSGIQNNKTQQRSRQPGYYLACAISGMSAGLPPHQGFTYMGISGVETIFHSSGYFEQDDLEEISNGGWYLFAQETESSQPYTMHQLTTDTSDTRNMEFSVVRVFDYISRFYKAILENYIGRYNVNPQTLDNLKESINNGTEQLRGDSLPRIGAPLLDAEIDSISIVDGQRDRVDLKLLVDLPLPLNRIGLRIVA